MSVSKPKTNSNQSTETTTHNADNRNLVEGGGIAGSASAGGSVTINSTDGGAFDIVSQSIDALTTTQAKGLDGLLDAFGRLMDTGKYVIDQNTKLAGETIAGYSPTDTARTELEGNKSLLIAAGIGAVALVIINSNK